MDAQTVEKVDVAVEIMLRKLSIRPKHATPPLTYRKNERALLDSKHADRTTGRGGSGTSVCLVLVYTLR